MVGEKKLVGANWTSNYCHLSPGSVSVVRGATLSILRRVSNFAMIWMQMLQYNWRSRLQSYGFLDATKKEAEISSLLLGPLSNQSHRRTTKKESLFMSRRSERLKRREGGRERELISGSFATCWRGRDGRGHIIFGSWGCGGHSRRAKVTRDHNIFLPSLWQEESRWTRD